MEPEAFMQDKELFKKLDRNVFNVSKAWAREFVCLKALKHLFGLFGVEFWSGFTIVSLIHAFVRELIGDWLSWQALLSLASRDVTEFRIWRQLTNDGFIIEDIF